MPAIFFHVFLIFSQVLITIGSRQRSTFFFLFSMNGRPSKFCRPPRLLPQSSAPCSVLQSWGCWHPHPLRVSACSLAWRTHLSVEEWSIGWDEQKLSQLTYMKVDLLYKKKNVHNHPNSQSQLFKQFTESGVFPGLTKGAPLKDNVAHSSFQWIPRQSRKETRPLPDNGAH